MSTKDDDDLAEARDQGYVEGRRAAAREQLTAALAVLGWESVEAAAGCGARELDEARAALREVCRDHGDNDWSDDLNLSDVIEKHLAPYLEER